MEQIAFIAGETILYWSSIITAFGAAAAMCMFGALYLEKTANWLGTAMMIPLSAVFSLVLSRLIHWYCCASGYSSFFSAMTDYASGGYALIGAFAGCILAAGVLRLFRIVDDFPEALDVMSLAGAAGITIGRLAAFFNASDRGMLLENETRLPLACASVNGITGITEYHFATFLFQAMAAGVIFIGLLAFWLWKQGKQRPLKSGDTCLIFLVLYCASQALLDSTRYDSLFLRSNGFVSLVQILCALSIVAVAVIFSVRMVRAMGWRYWFLALWIPQAAMLGGAGYMEYYVQRHGDQALFAYSIMGSCLLGFVILALVIRILAVHTENRPNFFEMH